MAASQGVRMKPLRTTQTVDVAEGNQKASKEPQVDSMASEDTEAFASQVKRKVLVAGATGGVGRYAMQLATCRCY
jgi:NADPH:quinone reductase-like Zn-dependent oxidoreductase